MKPKTYTLSNGMQVVLEENKNAPVVGLNFLCRVGSADETDSEAGISHLIEHMVFKGTQKRKVGQISKDVEAAGGDINAYTSFDQTCYYINMASRFLEKGVDILTDLVCAPTFDAEELEREKEVVCEEIRREQDNPGRMVGEHLFKTAFRKHNYGRPIIGFQKTVKGFSRNDLVNYYRRWYAPNNCIFVAVGDFETDKLLGLLEKYLHNFQGRTVLSSRSAEPEQASPRFIAHPDNIQSTYLGIGFHIPNVTHPAMPALDILSHILGGTSSSRLEQTLREKKRLVQNTYAYAYAPKDPGLLILGGTYPTKNTDKVLASLYEEIDKMQQRGPTLEELKRAKTNIKASQVYERETVGGQSSKIAYFLGVADNLEFEESYFQKIPQVTAEEVRQTSQQYLTAKNATASFLVPKGEFGKGWNAAAKKQITERKDKKKIPREKLANVKPECIFLSNGLKVVLKKNPLHPTVSFYFAALGGLLDETPRNNGIHNLMQECLVKGTKHRSALQVTEAIESMAGDLEGFSGKNSYGLKAEVLSDFTEEATLLFCETLLEPAWEKSEVAKEKMQALHAIKNQEDSLSSVAFYHFQKLLFPKHPYGLRALGEKKSVETLTPQLLRRQHEKLIQPKNSVLSIVGDIDPASIRDCLEKNWKKLSRSGKRIDLPRADSKPKEKQKIVTHKEKAQAHIVMGFQGPTLRSKDRHTMTFLNSVLSGMGGRLFMQLRDKQSLAYSVSSMLQEGLAPGFFAVYIGTDPAKVETAIKGIEEELSKISNELITVEEFERTRNYLVGTYELGLQKNASLASAFAFNELYGLGWNEVYRYPEEILKVTREDILKAAQHTIDLERVTTSIVMPKKI